MRSRAPAGSVIDVWPGRFASLRRFLDYVLKHDKAWVCRRIDIARHWHQRHPYQPAR
jgi:peptidoglycan/xylan/chitin deacetylase (PgdA/CDA1 family)